MTTQPRNNNFDYWILPEHDNDGLYWPTDSEFMVIANVVLGEKYYEERVKRYGEKGTELVEDRFNAVNCYSWLNDHLQDYVKGYTVELTSEMVLDCLLHFEGEVVAPWLAAQKSRRGL